MFTIFHCNGERSVIVMVIVVAIAFVFVIVYSLSCLPFSNAVVRGRFIGYCCPMFYSSGEKKFRKEKRFRENKKVQRSREEEKPI